LVIYEEFKQQLGVQLPQLLFIVCHIVFPGREASRLFCKLF
jgi:hypothetical protein